MTVTRTRVRVWFSAAVIGGAAAVFAPVSQLGSRLLTAQPEGNKANKSTDAEGDPDAKFHATLKLDDTNRGVRIHRAAQVDSARRGVYYHRPLMAFVERPANEAGVPADYPPTVWKLRSVPDGSVTNVHFRLQLSTPELRKACARVVVGDAENGDQDWAKANNLSLDNVRVYKFPLRRMVVDCMIDDEVLATWHTDSMVANEDYVDFFLPFASSGPDSALGRFVKTPDCRFSISYSYNKVVTDRFEVEVTATKTVNDVIRSELTAEQRSKPNRIFLQHKAKVERAIQVSLQRSVRASSYKAFEASQQAGGLSPLAGKVFERDELNLTTMADDADLKRALADYLKPIIQNVVSKRTDAQQKEITDGRTKTDTVTTEQEGKAGADANGANVGVSKKETHQVTEAEKHEVSQKSGVTFEQTKDKKYYAPSKVETFRVVDGAQELKVTAKEVGFIVVGKNDEYLEDTPVSQSFTLEKLKPFPPVDNGGRYYDGVPLGAMLPYFGEALPKGYVWANGTTNWPDEPWVFPHLRGKPVPDMGHKMIGGVQDAKEIGLPWTSGMISVSGGSFALLPDQLRETGKIQVKEADVELHVKRVLFNPIAIDGESYRKSVSILAGRGFEIEGFEGMVGPRKNRDRDRGEAEGLGITVHEKKIDHSIKSVDFKGIGGKSDIPLTGRTTMPAHVMCHWIIRVK